MRTLDCHFPPKLLRYFFFFVAFAASRRSSVEAFELNFLLYDIYASAFANDILCSLNFSKLILDVFFCIEIVHFLYECVFTTMLKNDLCAYIKSLDAGWCWWEQPFRLLLCTCTQCRCNKQRTNKDVSNDKYWMEIIKSMLCWILNKFYILF